MSFLDHFEDFLGQATATEKRSGWCFYMLLGDLLQCPCCRTIWSGIYAGNSQHRDLDHVHDPCDDLPFC